MSAEFYSSTSQPTTLEEAQTLIAELQQKLQWSELQRSALEERLRLRRIEKYGAGSEKLSNLQLELLEEEPGVSQAEVQAESERPRLDGEAVELVFRRQRKSGKHPGRQTLPPNLPRVEQVIACSPEQCLCGICGQEKELIGYEISERLDVEPAKYFVQVTKREKLACRRGHGGVVTAPAPQQIIEKGLVSDRVVIQTLVRKYCEHLPLYRQAQIYARQGINLDRSTLADWVGRAAFILQPVHERLMTALKASPKLFADETTAPVLDPGRGRTKTGQLWAHARDDRPWGGTDPPGVAYVYAPDRKAKQPITHLAGFNGILQVDGYGGYRTLAERNDVQLAFLLVSRPPPLL